MRTVKYDVLVTITAIIQKYKGNWSYVTRDKLLELLRVYYKDKIGYRQLGYHLRDLKSSKLIKTYRRNHRNEDGTFCLLTTARGLTVKGCKYLLNRGYRWAAIHLQKLKSKYQKYQKGRPEKDLTSDDQTEAPRKPGQNPFLDPKYRKKHGFDPDPPFRPQES